jgi:hypothetical protein
VREDRWIVSRAVLIAMAANEDGKREVPGVATGPYETETCTAPPCRLLRRLAPAAPPACQSRPGEKLACIPRHRAGLRTFLRDGRVEIGSHSVENLIRPIVLHKEKRALRGARRGRPDLAPQRVADRSREDQRG